MYDLKIGERTPAGAMVIADFTAPAKGFHSQTTSCHVNGAKTVADYDWHPATYQYTFKN